MADSIEGLRVAIAGGSLGGLLAALELRAIGCDAHVYERSSVPLEGRGAGIVLHPATTGFLERRGSFDLDRVSSSATSLRYLDASGAVAFEEPIAYRFTSYATLYAALIDALPSDRYALDRAVVAAAPTSDDRVAVTLSDGSTVVADLLVGADGIRSTVRSMLFPQVRPAYAGYVAWRGTVLDRDLPAAADALGGRLTYHVGQKTHMLTYEIPAPDLAAERSINWVWYRNLDEPDLDDVLTDPTGIRHDLSLAPGQVRPAHRDALVAAAADLPPPFTALVRATPEPFLQVVVDLEVPRMVHGRICLLGDAAFALRPHVAVGTAKAADDARALAGALAEAADVPEALRIWEPERLTLARSAAARSREVGERAQFRGTFTPGDPQVAFGLRRPKDGSYPDLT